MQDVCLEQRVQESEQITPEVTRLAHSPIADTVAAGYANGEIRIWDASDAACLAVLQSHSGSISALAFNANGGLIASGSQDTDIIVWDVAGEVGLYKLKAHTNQVTAVVFLDTQTKLLSSGKDGFVRVWDLTVQFCVQVVPIHSGTLFLFSHLLPTTVQYAAGAWRSAGVALCRCCLVLGSERRPDLRSGRVCR